MRARNETVISFDDAHAELVRRAARRMSEIDRELGELREAEAMAHRFDLLEWREPKRKPSSQEARLTRERAECGRRIGSMPPGARIAYQRQTADEIVRQARALGSTRPEEELRFDARAAAASPAAQRNVDRPRRSDGQHMSRREWIADVARRLAPREDRTSQNPGSDSPGT